MQNEYRYQNRKLNKCAICGTQKALAIHSADNGKLYFLCRGHSALQDKLDEIFQKAIGK